MGRKRDRVHLSVTIPAEQHAALVDIATDTGATLSDVVRELVNIATKTRSKSDAIRLRISVDEGRDSN